MSKYWSSGAAGVQVDLIVLRRRLRSGAYTRTASKTN